MRDRSSSLRRRGLFLAVDVVLFTPQRSGLAVLVAAAGAGRSPGVGRERSVVLPSDGLRTDESLDEAAARIARAALGSAPAFLDQAAALGGARRAPDGANVTIVYFGLVPGTERASSAWVAASDLSVLSSRHRNVVDVALGVMRARVDQQPIAFRLLPSAFTLSELQTVYELLVGHRLHKASFRRSLHASALVEATEEWRSEGRGRPAQLFRYSPPPPRRRRQRRSVRFDVLG